MASLFPVDAFAGFGPTAARPATFDPLLGRVPSRRPAKLREGVRADAPRSPGVYGMLGRRGELIYVGKAKSLRCRLMSYFRDSRDPKAGRILEHTRTLVWETVPDEFGSLVRELELIRRHRPRFNVIGQPGWRRYCYVCLGRGPAPYAYVAKTGSKTDLGVYGPFASASMAGDAVRRLNDAYRLRDCAQSVKMHFGDQPDLFPIERSAGCLRSAIETCSAPCMGGCTRPGYSAQVRGAKKFLEGGDDKPIRDLTTKMMAASAAMEFERAAGLRDKLTPLEWLRDRLNWLREARRENTFVYPLAGPDGRTVWYLIHRGRVRGACYGPTCHVSAAAGATLVDEVFALDPGHGVTPHQVDHVLLVSGWFRKYPAERDGLMTPDQARERTRLQPPVAA